MAFLSSAVLEFFTSISIALMAVYFGFSYLGQVEFGTYGTTLTLFTGFFCLILAPEFYQPLRDLGTYYHDRAAGIGAADAIVDFLESDYLIAHQSNEQIPAQSAVEIQAENLVALSPQGQPLTKPLSFHIPKESHIALVGQSGAGKTSLINVLLGFLPYEGSLKINGVELNQSRLSDWRKQIAWVGQNPLLLQGSIKENLLLGDIQATDAQIKQALISAQAKEFTDKLGLDSEIKDGGIGVSVGQAQRLAITRALLRKGKLLLLDEPTASLDAQSENLVLAALAEMSHNQTTLMITHRIEDLKQCDNIFVMQEGEAFQPIKRSRLLCRIIGSTKRGYSIMRALLPFLRLFKFAKLPLFLGLVLMITGLASSIGLLTTSGWFLAATAIAGLGTLFNFFYPSASVRGLAIGRTLFRYFEKLVTHDATFRILAKLRVQVFEKIIPLSPAVLNRYRNSDLLNRLVSDVDTLDSLYLRLIAPFITAIFVILAMCIGLQCTFSLRSRCEPAFISIRYSNRFLPTG